MSKKIIHVNQQVIRHNNKYDTAYPPCRIQEGSKARYCEEVVINGPSKMVYHPNDPLKCGARLWIETESDIELLNETTFKDLNVLMKQDREKLK